MGIAYKGLSKFLRCAVRVIRNVVLFILFFLLYHIIFSGFFPVDEDGVLIVPDSYMWIGFAVSAVGAYLIDFFNPKKKKTNPKFNIEETMPETAPAQAVNAELPSIDGEEDTETQTPLKTVSSSTVETNDIPCNPPIVSAVRIPNPSAAESNEQIRTDTNSRRDFSSFSCLSIHQKVDADLLTIDFMEGHDFEYWCADALKDLGFSDVSVTPGSGDHGVDVLASKDGIKYAIQCKRYTSDLGNSPVQEVYAGKAIYNCQIGVVITNQGFTEGAKKLAAATGVLLWDRAWIKQYLIKKHTDFYKITQEKPVRYDNGDEMFPAAVAVVLETGQVSVSMIKIRLNIGYARAARIVDEMEEKGIVGPFQGSKPRDILITKAQWELIK